MYKNKEKDLLLGVILGDGSIYKTKYSYEIYIGHGEKQKDYLEWKVELLNKNIFDNSLKIKSKMIYNKSYNKSYLQFYTRKSSKNFKELYDVYYNTTNKRLKNMLQNFKSDRSTAIWFMDDGSVFKKKSTRKDGSVYYLKPTMKLCTHCFTKEENIQIIDWFKRRYLIDAKLVSETKRNIKYYYIRFNSEDSFKLFKIMKPYIEQIDSMKNKFSFFYEYYYK